MLYLKGYGLLQVYTGTGKGKTTAALGVAFRAAGRGAKTLVIQYMKDDPGYGEFMNEEKQSNFYLVREEILPEAIKKTIVVKEILKRGELKTVNEAVEKVGLSRSAYYKYKDYVFPFYEASKEKIITLSLLLEHKPGVLSRVLNTIAGDSGSIMTINQGIPLQGVANTTISIETKSLTIDLEALLDKLRLIEGVKRLEVLGQVD